jgi:Cu-Zn family superoxide dismutase
MSTFLIKSSLFSMVILSAVTLTACQGLNMGRHTHAQAQLQARSDSQVQGQVTFNKAKQGLRVAINVSGLTPDQSHAIHVHANGDCSAADAASAGGHFNPDNQLHGSSHTPIHHAGDLPNLVADEQGRAVIEFWVKDLSLDNGASTDIKGRSVVVHERADDYESQPAGNAGKRIACGVIKMV